jgi:FkbH-like protein
MPFTNDFFYTVAQEWVSFLSVLKGLVKKCLVLDLDNTLWGGVVGEVGPLGVELGPQYPGLAYQNFQRALLEYYNRGILLTINSRNNEADILEVFEKNPQMILKQNHFAVIKANWNNKAENIVQIAEELNIGLDSLVFIDDDPLNREWVKKYLPQVKVLEFSIPPEEYVATLFAGRLFDQVNLTAEDMQRARMYTQESERKKLQVSKQTLAEYIKELGIVVKVSYNNLDQVTRISQLTLKTNQFNVTTTRYTEQDIERCIEDGFVYSADIADTFGPYGITALVIILPDETLQSAAIDTFLMSCRVMGRGIEYVLLDYCLRELIKKGFKTVRANFIPTNKNIPAKDFFNTAGFKTVLENQDEVRYELSLVEYVNKPKSQVVYDSIEIKSI